MLDLFNKYFLTQIIERPTRGNNILDLFAVNNEQFILNYVVHNNSKISDHKLTLVNTTQYLHGI